MFQEVLSFVLLAAATAFALFSLETSNLYRAVFGLFGMSAALGVLFILMSAYYVGIAQLLIYAGGLIALFIIVVSLTEGKDYK